MPAQGSPVMEAMTNGPKTQVNFNGERTQNASIQSGDTSQGSSSKGLKIRGPSPTRPHKVDSVVPNNFKHVLPIPQQRDINNLQVDMLFSPALLTRTRTRQGQNDPKHVDPTPTTSRPQVGMSQRPLPQGLTTQTTMTGPYAKGNGKGTHAERFTQEVTTR